MKIFKKIAAITTAAVMAAGTMCVDTFAADTYKLYVSSDPASASVGDTVKVSVLIDTPDDGIGVLGYRLVFDTDYLEYQTGTAKAGIGGDSTLNDMANVNVNSAADGWIGFAYMSEGAKIGTAVESLSLEFKIMKPNAVLSLTQIEITAADFDGTDITDKGTCEGAKIACSHKNTEKKTTPATCRDEGKEETVCKDCNEVVKTETLPKTEDHDWGEWQTKENVKCGETADQTRTCKVCGKIETRTGEVVEHIWDNGKVTKEPTCTEDGVKTFTCTREGCGETRTDSIKALGHDMDDGVVTKEATCTEKGEKTYSCKRAGCDEKKVEEIAALGHKLPEDKEVIKDATCTEKGQEKGVCERCGEEVVSDIPELGHDWGEWVVTKEATAEEDGEQERVCNRCEEKETKVIDATGGNPPVTSDSTWEDQFINEPYIPSAPTTTTAAEAAVTTAAESGSGSASAPNQSPTENPFGTEPDATKGDESAAPSQSSNENGETSVVTTANSNSAGDSDDNLHTGVIISIIPAVIAAAGVVIFKKKK